MPLPLPPASAPASHPRRTRALTALAGAVAALAVLVAPAGAASPPTLTPFAGNGTTGAVVPGPALSTRVSATDGIGTDPDGNVYVTQGGGHRIDKITPDGTISFFAGNGTNGAPVAGPALSSPLGDFGSLAVDGAGNVIVIERDHHRILRITPAGALSIIAGNGSSGSPVAGPALASPLDPGSSLAADAAGNVYFQDDVPETVWKLTTGGALVKIAGNGTTGLATPGPALASPMDQFYGTFAVGADGTVYAADTSHCVVVAITAAGALSFAAGTGSCGGTVPGPATATQLQHVQGVALDASGNLYLAVRDDHTILRVAPGGALSVYAGNGSTGTPVAGPPTSSPLGFLLYVTADPAGTLYISDSTRIQRIGTATPSAPRSLVVTPGNGSAALSFRPPITPGTSTVTGYELSTDGGITWRALATSPGAGTTLAATVPGLSAGTSTNVLLRAVNGSGGGETSAGVAVIPAPAVVITAPAATAPAILPTATPAIVPSIFKVAVRLRLPAGCGKGCEITRATLALRDGTTILGTRSGIAVVRNGWVRFTIVVDHAALAAAGSTLAKPGWRTTQTRFTVATRSASGTTWSAVKRGHITVATARLASRRDPYFPGLL